MGFLMKSGRRTSYYRVYGFTWSDSGQSVVSLKEYTSKEARDKGELPIGRKDVVLSFPQIYKEEIASCVVPLDQIAEMIKANEGMKDQEAESIIGSKMAEKATNERMEKLQIVLDELVGMVYEAVRIHPDVEGKKAC